ncbi:hypothetical protein [Actinopolymorpha pittospori]
MSRTMTLRARAPRVLLAVLATALLVVVSGCGTAGVTKARVEGAIGPTFANLYALQRYQLGYPKLSGDKIPAKATCDKGGTAEPDEGPGNNWTCTIVWQVAGPGTSATPSTTCPPAATAPTVTAHPPSTASRCWTPSTAPSS